MNIKPLFAVAMLGAVLAGTARADTYALLIGINDYPTPLDANGNPLKDREGKVIDPDLRGAVNDVNAVEKVLREKYGLPESSIRKLTDKAANTDGFVNGMKWLLSSAKPGDQVVFHYSGHGGQIKAEKSEAEPDGLDEVIVLADDKLVSDNLFGEIARDLAAKGVHATIIFDSCHSGGMSREGLRIKARSDLSRNRNAAKVASRTLDGLRTIPRGIVTGTGQEKGSYAFLFASKEDQTSADISYKDDVKPAHGIFTLILTAALNIEPGVGLEGLEPVIADLLKKNEFTQVPNFEYSSSGRAGKPLVWK
jgi:hypothetical protein